MQTLNHDEFGSTVKATNEKLFNMLPVLKDEYDNKYVFMSYEDEHYMDESIMESFESIIESQYDYIKDGASIGTMYDIGYNI